MVPVGRKPLQTDFSKLSLRSTLILWNVAASVLFVLICWVIFLFLTMGLGRSKFLNPGFIERVTHTVAESSPEEVESKLKTLNVPPGTLIALYRPNEAPRVVLGEQAPRDQEGLELAWKGLPNHRMVRAHSFTLWHPVRSGDDVAVVVGFGFPKELEPPTRLRHVLVALQAGVPATIICLAIMFCVNSKLTSPLRNLARATERLGRSELDYRVQLAGPSEFSDLARSFNEMAARLEDTLNDLTTEKLRVESIEQSRRNFLADMSHNLGTPLAAIQGWLGTLSDSSASPERQAILSKIERQVTYLSRTSGRLLDLSRWEHSSPELFWEDFPVAEPLFDAVESIEEEALERHIVLEFEGVEHHRVRADRARVREMFQIFLENAVRYAGDGSTVQISMRASSGVLGISVSDNGTGIPTEEIPHLTERFHSSTGGGCGLGLAIAAQLARALGGRLQVQSAPQAGTTISFELKLSPIAF